MSDSAVLMKELHAAMDRWRLAPDGPLVETRSGCIAFVRHGPDRRVLKMLSPGSDETIGVSALAHYKGIGAVNILDRTGRAMLLERIEPGHQLAEYVLAGNDDRATGILCDVMQALHRSGPPATTFPLVEAWGESFADYRRTNGPLPSPLVERAEVLYRELCESQGPRVLLHGDLHHDNVLYDARRGWLAVDPKGVLGEPAYETGAALRNPTADVALFATPAIIDRRVRILCERLLLDRARVLGWCFAQAVLAAIWAVEDETEDERGVATAQATLPLLAR